MSVCRIRLDSRCTQQDNIKIDIKYLGCELLDWIRMAQDRDQWGLL
jgi:hypothetical protein